MSSGPAMGLNWRGENNHHGALNFYPIFIPRFESKVSGVSAAVGLKS